MTIKCRISIFLRFAVIFIYFQGTHSHQSKPNYDCTERSFLRKGVQHLQSQNEPIILLSPSSNVLLLENNEVEGEISFVLTPEIGRNVSDYLIRVESSNQDILQDSGIELSAFPIGESLNISGVLFFEQQVGTVNVSITAIRSDVTVYSTSTVGYVICGISVFHLEKEEKKFLREATLISEKKFSGETVTFAFFVQYPDGSTSESLDAALTAAKLDNIKVQISNPSLVPEASGTSCLFNHITGKNARSLKFKDNCTYGFHEIVDYGPLLFSVVLGSLGHEIFQIKLSSLSVFHSFFEEQYHLTINIQSVFVEKVSIFNVLPYGPFRKSGGDIVYFDLLNARSDDKFELVVFQTYVNASIMQNKSDSVRLGFVCPPGQGKSIPWDLIVHRGKPQISYSCPWSAIRTRFVFNFNSHDLRIDSVRPDVGPNAGGITITCTGFFFGFQESRDYIIIGGLKMTDVNISSNQRKISFLLPKFSKVSSRTNIVQLSIVINDELSNYIEFKYESLSFVYVEMIGGKFEKHNNSYLLSRCRNSVDESISISAMASTNSGADPEYMEYEWRLYGESRKLLLHRGKSTESNMFTFNASLLSYSMSYSIRLDAKDVRYNTKFGSETNFALSFEKKIGMFGYPSELSRSMQYPPAEVRILVSFDEIPDCVVGNRSENVSFEWTYNNVKTTKNTKRTEFSNELFGPRRFGREFIIPKATLKYGMATVSVRSYFQNSGKIIGSLISYFEVVPPTPIAIIGSGESKVTIPFLSTYAITGKGSFDPDDRYGGIESFIFHWQCELSMWNDISFVVSGKCPNDFFPESWQSRNAFEIRADSILIPPVNENSIFIRFNLTVSKIHSSATSSSAVFSQIIEIINSGSPLHDITNISLSTLTQDKINYFDVPFYEDIFISVSGGRDNYFKFSTLEKVQSRTIQRNVGENLLENLTSYIPGTLVGVNRSNVLLKSGLLKPETTYILKFFYHPPVIGNKSTDILIITRSSPKVSFFNINPVVGTTTTAFYASAKSQPNEYKYKFYFLINITNSTGICVDGCSGSSRTQFTIPKPGVYLINVIITDSFGKLVLATGGNIKITITTNDGFERSNGQYLINRALVSKSLGDHASYVLSSFFFLESINTLNMVKVEDWMVLSRGLSTILSDLPNLYRRTSPNSECGRDYMLLVSKIAGLKDGNVSILNEENALDILAMVVYVVNNTGPTIRFNVLDNMNATLSSIASFSQQYFSGGTNRSRLVSNIGDVDVVTLQVAEIAVPSWSTVRLQGGVCGTRYSAKVGTIVNINCGLFCSEINGNVLVGEHSSIHWCGELYTASQSIEVTIGEFNNDFISSSGILSIRDGHKNVILGEGLSVPVDTSSMYSHGISLVRARLLLRRKVQGVKPGCLRIRQHYKDPENIFGAVDGTIQCSRAIGLDYVTRKQVNRSISSQSYKEIILSTVSGGTTENSSVVSVAKNDSLYGVKWIGCIFQRARVNGRLKGSWITIFVVSFVFSFTILGILCGIRALSPGNVVTEDNDGDIFIDRDNFGRDVYGSDVFVGNDDVDDVEIFTERDDLDGEK